MEEGASGVQHGPAGHADRARCAAGYMRLPERDPPFRQLVEVGRLDPWIAQGADGVEALIVGEEEEDVRFHVNCLFFGRVIWALQGCF